jgi:hypothetical protein
LYAMGTLAGRLSMSIRPECLYLQFCCKEISALWYCQKFHEKQ